MSDHVFQPSKHIPFRYSDIIEMCLSHDDLMVQDKSQFWELSQRVKVSMRDELAETIDRVKDHYAPLDPDSDVIIPECSTLAADADSKQFLDDVKQLLKRANFESISQEAIKKSLGDSSLFKIRLDIDFSKYEDVFLFYRGISKRTQRVSQWFGLRKKQIEFINYDRVFVYIKFNSAEYIEKPTLTQKFKPNSTILRLFQNVPQADIEMLFPDTKIGWRMTDKLLIGVPAIISGLVVVSTKLGASVIILSSLLGFWLGLNTEPTIIDKSALVGIAAGFGALAGYIWKQYSSFKNRKLKFSQALTSNLYFKLLDNNVGTLLRIADNAEAEESKEIIVAYFFLLINNKPTDVTELDELIEQWFQQRWRVTLDFDIADAIAKLERLGFVDKRRVDQDQNVWQAKPLKECIDILGARANIDNARKPELS